MVHFEQASLAVVPWAAATTATGQKHLGKVSAVASPAISAVLICVRLPRHLPTRDGKVPLPTTVGVHEGNQTSVKHNVLHRLI